MKKLLGIVVLGLLLSGNAYSKEVLLKKCFSLAARNSFDDKLNYYYFKIDTSKKIMHSIVNWKKKPDNAPKVHIVKYKLNYIDNNIAQGVIVEENGTATTYEVIVDLNEKTISMTDLNINIKCQ